ARLYRTGDQVRRRRTGALEFLGRRDHQVKVRGFRIELGEIDAVLRGHPSVLESVVVVREDVPGDRRLVAYVAGNPEVPADAAALRAHLEQRLPAYMVPPTFVWLERLPLSPTGKIDRAALPAPDEAGVERGAYAPPRTPAEEVLAGIYAEVLGVERVGVRDSFFDLGGHSLLATRVVSRVRELLGAELPLPTLFESPTVERLAAALARAGAPELPAVVPIPRAGGVPLSFAQERLWFLDRLQPGGSAYNLPAALRLRGPLDERALERSLAELVRRHESLRTTFGSEGGEPVQVIHPPREWVLVVEDLSTLPAGEREREAGRHARVEAERPFDLAAGPLFRARLLRLGDGEHVLLLVVHHVVFDGWSTGVLLRELGAIYTAFARGRPSPLPEPGLQYADYAGWQGEHLRSGRLDAQLAYWRERLSGAPALLELPTDRPRPAAPSHRGAVEHREVPAALARRLRALGRQEGATPFMVLLAAFQLLLSKHSGEEDVVVGSPIAGRTRAELEGLVGFFVNTLALRTDLSGDPSFRELLGRVRGVTLGAYAHQELPFERLVQDVAPERSLGHAPLFQVMLSLQNAPREELRLDGVEVEWLALEDTAAKFDLSLFAGESGDALELSLQYATDLLDASTARRMLEHLGALLEGAAAHPDRRLSELEMLGGSERAQLVREWSGTAAAHPHACIHTLFARQAAATPERTALVHGAERVGYAELDTRANRLAHHLRAAGAGPEVRVGVLLERTPEMVVALLAVLKAGGAYVPLDAANPAERLGYMIEDAQVSLVLTTTALAERLPGSAAAVLRLDTLGPELERQPAEAPESGVLPANLSHVIFTSGSTGRPKGVMIRHSGASVLLHWMRETVTDHERSCALFSTSISFDVSVAELFGTLCWGGTAVLVENALELATVSEPVVYASMVPTAAAELLRTGGVPRSVRTLNLAGEALSGELAQGLYALGTVEKVGNVYGPTEDTTYSTCSVVPKGALEVRIGRPLPGTRTYVLDAHLNPVPVGVAGELYLAGEGVARGYASRPDLTAERFVPDPFGPPGTRMYRTQDRVRWRADGELEYFGRTDHQVKVRGFRVELGEIGAVLGAHPAVAEAVVVARPHGGDLRLVAYVVPRPGAPADDAALRVHLEGRLPAYMVPATLVWLDRLPLTSTGKIDRNALPEPEWGHAATASLTPPRTPVEQVLAEQWREVLGVERVGRESNFFQLGGHSLLATRVVSRLREVFGVELPVRALFERPTLAGLAERIEAARRTERPAPPPIVRRPHDGEAPLSFAQERLWLLEQMQPGTTANNIARPLSLTGPLHVRALEDALAEVVRRHETLRTTFASAGGRPVQKIAPTAGCALRIVDLESVAGGERTAVAARLIAEESGRTLDLSAGPLFRATLLRCGAEDHTLLLTMHHIVSDGWSLGVLVGEVAELYRAFSAGGPSPLAPLPVQYSDYCRWQREWLQGDVLEAELRYWRDRLGGPQPLLELPADRPRGAVRGTRGAIRHQRLPAPLVEELDRLAVGSGASPFMALLAGFVSLLNRYTGQEDVRVGTFIANRTRAEVEPLFGFFLNNLVLRTGVAPDDTFRTLLGQVRDVTLDAYAHQEVPFEKVLEAVNPERALSHTPLFQVMFVLQNTPIPPLQLRDLSVRVLPVETTGSNFDMTLWVEETDGLRLSLQYDADLFDGTTIERLLGHLAALLQAAVSDPDVPLHRVALLGAGERHALLVEANDTGPAPAADRHGVHGLVEARARVAPDAVAVRQGGAALTYRELNRTANRLAHHLRARGAGPETRVALLADRSPRMIAGLLGILKSGAAYVPLDPRAPVDRLAHILKDLGAGVLVADDALVGGLGAHVPGVVGLDGAWAHEDGAPEHDPAPLGGGSDAAYVIYTSGSTGRPKGVLVEHRSLRAYTETAIGQYGIGPQDRLLQFASVSFDASIEEIFPALASGATLVLRDDVMLGSPPLFWEACAREGVTVANLPTAYWHELAGALGGGPSPLPACVRLVIIGGERALSERVARWQRVVGPAVRLVNTYGPTEATVVATLRDLTGWRAGAGRDVPIGRPVRSATAYVLGSDGHPMPAGVPGELYLGGAGLARGYLDRPALTAERFVPDPFAAEPGARLYRTGDLARFLPAGELEFVGRGDGQVKIRGYRVELQEVEARLAEHPAVGAAAVVLRRSGEGEPYLAAFVVWSQAEPPTTADLRTFVGESLPEYMVPSLVVSLDALPMTPGGKVDARALPATDRPREEASGGYVAPRTPTEEILASIWAQVLGVERVGVNDSFFELGGYSLLATQVIARIRDAFGVELPLVKLFQARTLADLAGSITDASQTLLPEVERVSRDGPLPLSFAQERIWFLTQLAPELSAYHVPRALRIRGPLVPGAIEQSYGALVARHEVLRTTFPSVGGRPVQVIHPPAPVPVPVVDLSGLPGPVREEEVQRIIVEVGRKRFDLANGPLIRVVLLRLGADEHVVVQAEHHLVHDGWAEGVLMRDLLGSFSAFVEGRPAALPELPIQFADYAAWQRRWVDGPVLEEQLGYWKAQLAGAPAVLELPTDRPRPPVQRFQGGEELLPLSVATVAALREMGRREGVTLFMAALAGFNALLHRYSGQDDIVVGTVLANRRWREAEGLLGMILNTLPLRTSLQGDPTVRELLGTVRQTCLGAYGHQDAPFEMIVDAVRPQRNLSYPAVFQVMFAFHDARMPMLEAPGFVLTGLDAHNRSSKFDMLVIVQADPAPEGEERGMTAAIEYNSDLFDAATIQRFARHFENLLRILPASLDLRLSELPLMDDAERAELSGWNATGARYGEESSCLHELFEAQAARTPEAVAVAWGEETWSYRRLNARATA
ncbi:MAG: tycC3, partial [Gemmatimonadetes bacterium]|nr:tycC3 [Gemmatimonadota bacterium]